MYNLRLSKILAIIILLLLGGCNNENSNIVNYKLSECILPSIPYGAPIVKTKLRLDELGNIKEILIHLAFTGSVDNILQ